MEATDGYQRHPHRHSCACDRNRARPSPWAEKSLSVAQTCVDWIPVKSTGTRAAIAGLSKQNRPEAPGRLRPIIFKSGFMPACRTQKARSRRIIALNSSSSRRISATTEIIDITNITLIRARSIVRNVNMMSSPEFREFLPVISNNSYTGSGRSVADSQVQAFQASVHKG